jgi:hypothetical protein
MTKIHAVDRIQTVNRCRRGLGLLLGQIMWLTAGPMPRWLRLAAPFLAVLLLFCLFVRRARGRRFPPMMLVQCEPNGRRVSSGRVLNLYAFRRRVPLGGIGFPGCMLFCSARGEVFVQGKCVIIAKEGRAPLSVSDHVTQLEPGDTLCTEAPDGSWLAFRLENL